MCLKVFPCCLYVWLVCYIMYGKITYQNSIASIFPDQCQCYQRHCHKAWATTQRITHWWKLLPELSSPGKQYICKQSLPMQYQSYHHQNSQKNSLFLLIR